MRRCYILVRQSFYVSNGVPFQCEDDNPVVEVFTTAEVAKDVARRIVENHIKYSSQSLHMVEEEPNSELIYKVGAFNTSGICDVSYSVIRRGMMV